MKNWNNIIEKWEEIPKVKKIGYGKSVTDKSHFRPNVNCLNNIVGAESTEIDASKYLFKDGKDNGVRIYELTDKKLDITERQAIINSVKQMSENAKENIKENFEKNLSNEIDNFNAMVENNTNKSE